MAKKTETAKKDEYKERIFNFNGIKLEDPDKDKSPDEVRDFYSGTYPALTNASVKGPTVNDGIASFDFKPVTGTKG